MLILFSMSFAQRGKAQEAQRAGRFGAHKAQKAGRFETHKAQSGEVWDHPSLGEVTHGAAEQSSVSLAMVAMRSLLWLCILLTSVKRALPEGMNSCWSPQGGWDGWAPVGGQSERRGRKLEG